MVEKNIKSRKMDRWKNGKWKKAKPEKSKIPKSPNQIFHKERPMVKNNMKNRKIEKHKKNTKNCSKSGFSCIFGYAGPRQTF